MNINLNAGGIIGAVLGGGSVLLYGVFTVDGGSHVTSSQLDASSSYFSRALLFAVIAGALGGTALWSAAFGQKKQP